MVNETISLQSTSFELATFGEVLYAFSALRSTSTRRRAPRAIGEILPWESMSGTAVECEPLPEPRKAPVAPMPRIESSTQAHLTKVRRTSGRCTCGQCRNCQENARWERIFQEKFANSDYYRHDIRVRYASPLSSL